MILAKEGESMFMKKDGIQDQDACYHEILLSLDSLLQNAPTPLAKLSNAAALLNVYLDNINWVGFYLAEGERLTLGPFQGLPACDTILLTQGVCGKAATTQSIQRVDDVHQFPGHIACDAKSQSEIVLPIMQQDQLYAVLDIDAPVKGRFDQKDELYLSQVVKILEKNLFHEKNS